MAIELKFNKNGIKIFKGDNQEVLESLPSKSLNLIYGDILYNSGKKFDDYNDNLGSPKEAMKWYRPRIQEMYRVLKDNGSIYIHCNWRLDSYIRILLDEIFGAENFRNRIYRKHSETRDFVENYDSQVDVIFYYVKDNKNFIFNEIKGDKLRIIPLFENGYLEGRSFEFKYKDFEFNPKSNNKHWLIPKYKLEDLYEKGELVLIDGFPYRKTYVIPIGNLWDEDEMLDEYSRVDTADSYDTPKPPAVLKRIVQISSNEGDSVGDFFMGGGTTPEVALECGRVGTFCDISLKACNVTIGKLEKVLEKMNNK